MSGVKSTFYIIDNEPQKVFTGPISMKQLKDGQHKITFWSVDMVDNVEDKNAPENSFSFYLDRLNPEVTVTFDGDQYQKTKDIFYISGRTKIKVDAKDNYSGVEKITYILNQGGELREDEDNFEEALQQLVIDPNGVLYDEPSSP